MEVIAHTSYPLLFWCIARFFHSLPVDQGLFLSGYCTLNTFNSGSEEDYKKTEVYSYGKSPHQGCSLKHLSCRMLCSMFMSSKCAPFYKYICKCPTAKLITVIPQPHSLFMGGSVRSQTHIQIHTCIMRMHKHTHRQTGILFFLSLLITAPSVLISRHPVILYLKCTLTYMPVNTHRPS